MRIDPIHQINLWGRTGAGSGLEPQRSDLWYADLSNVVQGVNEAYRAFVPDAFDLPPLFPQFVQSVTLPGYALKAEAFRRGSVPFNMPSWDDPLESMKIVFLMEQNQDRVSATLDFLNRWQSLARVGRGPRRQESIVFPYFQTIIPFRFNFIVSMLRGGHPSATLLSATEIAAINAAAVQTREQQQRFGERMRSALGRSTLGTAPAFPVTGSVNATTSDRILSQLEVASRFQVTQAWLSSFKVSDLSYTSATLVTMEATLYPESIAMTDANAVALVP